MNPVGYIYILESHKSGSYYIGSTRNLTRRINQHTQGKVQSTRHLLPLEVKFYQKCSNLKLARQVECKLKRLKRRDIISRIIKDRQINMLEK